jgi:D-alanyl-D-alanine carboxypeptidase
MTTATRPRPLGRAPVALPRASISSRRHHWYWLAIGLALSFLIPCGLTDLVSINRDLYYGIYIGAVFAFVGAWIGCANDSPRAVLTRNWRAGVGLGALFAGAMVAIVLNEPATSRPGGIDFAAAVVWRGILYGFADGLILSAFPILAVFAAFAGTRALTWWGGKVGVGALALAVSLLFTAVYHLGYSDFRGEKVRKPIAGDVIWSVPTLATLSPLGAPIAHAGLHVAAVAHSYETDVFLPPHTATLDSEPLQALLDQAVTGRNRLAPGATAYVATADGSWSAAAGLADVARGTPMPVDARMRLESVSKIWTATLIYGLAEDEKLRLSDTIARWLPKALPYGDRITIAQLLSHTSGLIDNNDVVADPGPFVARVTDAKFRGEIDALRGRLQANPATEFSPTVWIRLAAFQPLLATPGTTYHYSNIGFELLGLIAGRASGQSLESLYRERIFAPLGFEDTAYDPQGPIAGSHVHGYTAHPLRDVTAAHPGVGAEGGLVSTSADTARFLVALMRGELLGPKELRAMKQGFWAGGQPTGCGGLAYGHSGGGYGFKTNAWVAADGSRVAVLLLNARGDASTDDRARVLMESLYCTARKG